MLFEQGILSFVYVQISKISKALPLYIIHRILLLIPVVSKTLRKVKNRKHYSYLLGFAEILIDFSGQSTLYSLLFSFPKRD